MDICLSIWIKSIAIRIGRSHGKNCQDRDPDQLRPDRDPDIFVPCKRGITLIATLTS